MGQLENMKDKVVLQPKPDYISWNDITELLHLAFAEHVREGLMYMACTQSEEQTRTRVGEGVCIVALLNGKLVGTRTLTIRGKNLHVAQLAVHPDYRGLGIAVKLDDYSFEYARSKGLNALIGDTSEKATSIVKWHLKRGDQIVGLFSHSTTNYYSVVLRRAVCGRKYTAFEARLRFCLSSCLCRLLLTEGGKVRTLAKPFYLLARKIYRIVR